MLARFIFLAMSQLVTANQCPICSIDDTAVTFYVTVNAGCPQHSTTQFSGSMSMDDCICAPGYATVNNICVSAVSTAGISTAAGIFTEISTHGITSVISIVGITSANSAGSTTATTTNPHSTAARTSTSLHNITHSLTSTTVPPTPPQYTDVTITQSVIIASVTISKPYAEVCKNTSPYVNEFCDGLRLSNPNDTFACLAEALNGMDCPEGVCACANRRRLLQDSCNLTTRVTHTMQITPLVTYMPQWVESVAMRVIVVTIPEEQSTLPLVPIIIVVLVLIVPAIIAGALCCRPTPQVYMGTFANIKIA